MRFCRLFNLSPFKSPSSPTGPMTCLIFLSLRAEVMAIPVVERECHCERSVAIPVVGHPRIVQERLGHSSIATTLDIYSHTVPGLQKAAAERLDTLLLNMEPEKNVGKMSAEGDKNERRPYRSRTCDTLIKSLELATPSSARRYDFVPSCQ